MKNVIKIFSVLSMAFIMCSCGSNETIDSSKTSDSIISSSIDSIENDFDLIGVGLINKTFTYDGNEHSLKLTGDLPSGLKVTYENNGQTEIGEYTVVAKVMTIDNEKLVNEYKAKLIIDKANYDMSLIKFEDKEFYYDGNEKNISISGTLPDGVTVTYEGNNVKEPGDYEVIAHFSHNNKKYNEIDDMKAKIHIINKPELSTTITDNTKLDLSKDGGSYEGKVFKEHGIGRVTYLRHVDGDTTWFKDEGGNEFNLRYYGIDTPESTNNVQPWGYEASAFTKDKLENATEIVLQKDTAEFQTVGNRLLGLVWIKDAQHTDFYCLNLLIVEQAYSKNQLFNENSLYLNAFLQAGENAKATGKRMYGEKDPHFDYSDRVHEVTIKDVYSNFDVYYHNTNKLHLTAMVTRIGPEGFYVQSVEPDEVTGEKLSLYAYTMNDSFGPDVQEGTIVSFYCTVGSFGGNKQLVNVSLKPSGKDKYIVIGQGEVQYEKVTEDTDITLPRLTNAPITVDLTVKKLGKPSKNNDVTLYATFKGTDKEFNVRIDDSLKDLYTEFYTPGINIRVKGILDKYSYNEDGSDPIYQLKLCSESNTPDIIKIS